MMIGKERVQYLRTQRELTKMYYGMRTHKKLEVVITDILPCVIRYSKGCPGQIACILPCIWQFLYPVSPKPTNLPSKQLPKNTINSALFQ
jgi:hypothetical protein